MYVIWLYEAHFITAVSFGIYLFWFHSIHSNEVFQDISATDKCANLYVVSKLLFFCDLIILLRYPLSLMEKGWCIDWQITDAIQIVRTHYGQRPYHLIASFTNTTHSDASTWYIYYYMYIYYKRHLIAILYLV